jgi:DNA-binding GntR family transcriptional regulator
MKNPRDEAPSVKYSITLTGLEGIGLVVDHRQSVTEQVHGALREAIVDVRLAPGSPISENSICRQFSVSRTPVRAALQRLVDEGLVEVFPQRGSFVAPIKLSELQDSHFVRRSLEVALLREVAPRWTTGMSRDMRRMISKQDRAIGARDADGFFSADEEFHHLLARFAEREGVWQAILAARVQLSRFVRSWAYPDRLADVIREHAAIVDALDRHDAAGAENALVTHLDMIFMIYRGIPEEQRRRLAI